MAKAFTRQQRFACRLEAIHAEFATEGGCDFEAFHQSYAGGSTGELTDAAHEVADLKARFGGKTEVLWTASGSWLPVIRWNKKSVTVRMAGEPDTIPHTQVGGAR